MPIPPFRNDGWLPIGHHDATWDFEHSLGFEQRRYSQRSRAGAAMIGNSAEFKVAVRNLEILEQSLCALDQQLAGSNPRLFEVSSEAYKRRIATLKADIERYRSNPDEKEGILIIERDAQTL